MDLPYDPNNPYDPAGVCRSLIPLRLATDVGIRPELQQHVSLHAERPNWQRDATKSANMVEHHEPHLPVEFDAPINCSFDSLLSPPNFSGPQSYPSFPSSSRRSDDSEYGSESKVLQSEPQHSKTCDPPPGKGGASNSGEGRSSGGGRPRHRRNNALRRRRMPQPPRKYACPLYLQSREKYERCENCVLTSWARVLQHLKRAHLADEDHCPTCRCSFDSEILRNEHIRLGNCQPADIAQSGVFLEEDYNKLKFIRQSSDGDKWRVAWRKMFPNLQTPSPYSESRFEFFTRTGRSTCLKALIKAAQGHDDLPGLATELVNDLTHTLAPAARGGDVDTTSIYVSQAESPVRSTACSPSPPCQIMPRPAQFRNLPEASPRRRPPQMPPDTPLPSQQQQIFAHPQQIQPSLPRVDSCNYTFVQEQFNPEPTQSEVPMQYSHNMTSHFPSVSAQHMHKEPELSFSTSSFVTPADLHSSLQNDSASFLPDEEMLSDEWLFG